MPQARRILRSGLLTGIDSQPPGLGVSHRQSCDAHVVFQATVAQMAKGDAFAVLLKSRDDLMESRVGQENEQKYDAKLKAELERIAKMDAKQRLVYGARKHIIDEILTMRCPRCRVAFIDFDECCALKCESCRAGFCAWCLAVSYLAYYMCSALSSSMMGGWRGMLLCTVYD